MIIHFLEGIQTLAKIHNLNADYDLSEEGYDIRIRFTNPNNGKYRDYIAHLHDYENPEEAVAAVGDFIADAHMSFWEVR